MSNELIPSPDQFNALAYMAKSANASKFYQKVGQEEGLLSIMLLARELDIPPMQALSGGIWNIQGKVEMSARMMNMKIRQAGHKMKIDSDANRCIITATRKDTGEELTVTFSMEDARRAELANGNVWKKYPREMLFNRCLSIIARMIFPDVIGNCYIEGEIKEAFTDDSKSPKETHENLKKIEYSSVEVLESKINVEEETMLPEILPSLPDCISFEQKTLLQEMIGKNKTRLNDLLKHYEIMDLEQLPAIYFDEVLAILSKKKEEK